MDPRAIAEIVSSCVLIGAVVWIGVVGVASLAGIAVWLEAVFQAIDRSGGEPGVVARLLEKLAVPAMKTRR